MCVITYPCHNLSQYMLVKGVPVSWVGEHYVHTLLRSAYAAGECYLTTAPIIYTKSSHFCDMNYKVGLCTMTLLINLSHRNEFSCICCAARSPWSIDKGHPTMQHSSCGGSTLVIARFNKRIQFIQHDNGKIENRLDFKLTNDSSYLAGEVEKLDVYCEYFWREMKQS